jgi:hypothetical protein
MRRLSTVSLVLLLLFALATPAWAQDAQTTEAFVVLSGRAHVPEGRQVGDLVVFHGSAVVDGTVEGSLTAFDAPTTISGRVNGDVVVFNGRVELRDGAVVTGDVVSQSAPVVASGATVGGTRRRVQTNTNWEGFGWAGRLAWWLAVSVSTLVVGLVLLWPGLDRRRGPRPWRAHGGHLAGPIARPCRPGGRLTTAGGSSGQASGARGMWRRGAQVVG